MSNSEKVLLPVDVAHVHMESLTLLNELIALSGRPVHLLYVEELLPAMEHMLRSVDKEDELKQKVASHAKSVMDDIAKSLTELGATVTQEITQGAAASTILNVARDEGFILTVVPPGSKQSADKLLLGRVSGKIARHAPGTVLLLRGDATAKLTNVVVGLDGSPESFAAMQAAVELFNLAKRGTKITLVNVVSVNPILTMVSPIGYISAIEGNLKMSGEALLAEGEKLLSDLGVRNVEMKQVEGAATEMLIKEANGASLIVVGAQGKGVVEHFLMGSTSGRLSEQANCPVVIFKNNNGKS